MKKFLFIMVIIDVIIITSCAPPKQSYIPPKDHDVNKTMSFNQEYDKIWQKTISFLGENNIAIDEIDKASGFIQASYKNSKLEGNVGNYLDCGDKISSRAMITGYIAKFNIIISKDNNTNVIVNTFFDIEGEKSYNEYWSGERITIQCNSTGVFEKEIFQYLKNQ